MSRVMMGLALAVGLAGSAAMGQVADKPSETPGRGPKPAAGKLPEELLEKLRQAGFPGRSEAGARSLPGIPGARPEPVQPRRPSEPPDPRAPMVMVQAVLVEWVQAEPGAAGRKKDAPASDRRREAKPADRPGITDTAPPERQSDLPARGKAELGMIDLDLSAPPAAILAELGKLGLRGRLDVLNRVQLTTLDKQDAYVQFGRMEPRITGISRSTFGTTNSVTLQNMGLIVGITPRVAPGGAVIVEIDLNQSRVGGAEEGVAIFSPPDGETIRQPPIVSTVFRSIVKAPAGKTVVVAAATSESGPRRTETLLLVSARVLNVTGE